MVSFQVHLTEIPERLKSWQAGWMVLDEHNSPIGKTIWSTQKSPQENHVFNDVPEYGRLFVYATFNGHQVGPLDRIFTVSDGEEILCNVVLLEKGVVYPEEYPKEKSGSLLPWLVGVGVLTGIITLVTRKQ